MVEKKRGDLPQARRRIRALARATAWLLGIALLLIGGGPLYAWLGLNFSGRMALSQNASAAQVVRGFDFGPVYLVQGQPGRYTISAQLPACDAGYWQTRFEVLDGKGLSVFREDEVRFIGDFQFQPGVRDTYTKNFELEKETGYYYFRFTAVNGEYSANPSAPPVVRFTIRQGVLTGWALWLPAASMLLLGAAGAWLALFLLQRLASDLVRTEAKAEVQAPAPVELNGRAALAARKSARRYASKPH